MLIHENKLCALLTRREKLQGNGYDTAEIKKGDTVGIVTLESPLAANRITDGIRMLQSILPSLNKILKLFRGTATSRFY